MMALVEAISAQSLHINLHFLKKHHIDRMRRYLYTSMNIRYEGICEINNGNCTEWSAIWSEIKRVVTKLQYTS